MHRHWARRLAAAVQLELDLKPDLSHLDPESREEAEEFLNLMDQYIAHTLRRREELAAAPSPSRYVN